MQFDLLGIIGTEEELNLLKNDASERDRPSRRTCSIYDGALFTADDFTAGRAAWRATLFGTEGENDPDIPGMTNLLAMRDADSDALRAEKNRGAKRLHSLWF